MRLGGGPEGSSFGFEESGISEMERLDLVRQLAGHIEASAQELGAKHINRDPIVHTMLSKVIEGGPDLDPTHAAHIRKMIALRMWGGYPTLKLKPLGTRSSTEWRFKQSTLRLKN